MSILLKKIQIIDSGSSLHRQTVDILIEDNIIKKIAATIDENADTIVSIPGLHVSKGWFDPWADFDDPGYGNKETLKSGSCAAASGGFTDVQIMPDTHPPLANRSLIERVLSIQCDAAIHPIGKITNDSNGINEMYDMHAGGAVTFSNGKKAVKDASLLLKALQYLLPLKVPVIQVPGQTGLNGNGVMHEGVVSTSIGLNGIPAIAEEMMIMRDLELVHYTGAPVHFTGVSTARGLKLIREAKSAGLPVTCSVSAAHSIFTDDDLLNYNTHLKAFPPFRTPGDREAIRNAILEGVVDCVASHHIPVHQDEKFCEFDQAAFGISSIQSVFNMLHSWLEDISIIVHLLTNGRNIFNHQEPKIEENAVACLTLFVPNVTYTLTKDDNKSLSCNNPFIGHPSNGRVAGTIRGNKLFLNA